MRKITQRARHIIMQVWLVIATQWQQGVRWLIAPRDPLTLAALRAKLIQLLPSTYGGRLAVLGVVVLLLVPGLRWYAKQQLDDKGAVTYPHASFINPILGGLGALFLIYAAIRQARTASDRHEAQTKADLQRRITESFSKAIEQLSSDKIEQRLGGIYTLERISKESPDDYWTIMETLTAFVRERARWSQPDAGASGTTAHGYEGDKADRQNEPSTDIAAVLSVIIRRSGKEWERERQKDWRFDLSGVDLRGARLWRAHLERAYLFRAHLEGAILIGAHLEGARLGETHLECAFLSGAHLEGASLDGANLQNAHLEGAALGQAKGLTQEQINVAIGNAETYLPKGLSRPTHWLVAAPDQNAG
jgi:hypothetical protein